MAARLTNQHTDRRSRALLAAAGALVVALPVIGWQARGAEPTVLTGTVALVNAYGTKICVARPPADQWCGRLATSGVAVPSVGQEVTVIVSTVDADPRGTLSIGTVIPAGSTLR